ncbi:hypothetical protein OsI_03589 [Oryza sativa Indica Group]|uniref:Uncharacterized protein n=1 Tax=Oryza sativa subsp. indica TaxID=39946 RepID=A2WUN6_ORYSI|nr:hypothetical protein OsI_03589 [Oryza sativa Indica Group]
MATPGCSTNCRFINTCGVLGDETKQAAAAAAAAATTTEWSSGSKMENELALRTIGAVRCATNSDPALDVPLT